MKTNNFELHCPMCNKQVNVLTQVYKDLFVCSSCRNEALNLMKLQKRINDLKDKLKIKDKPQQEQIENNPQSKLWSYK